MGRPSDGELVRRCREGDRAAFDVLVDRYRGATYALALQRVGDRDDAADVAQQALLAAYSGLSRLRAPERFAPWLRGITLRLSADDLTASLRRERARSPLPDDLPDPTPDPSAAVERDTVWQRVQAAVGGLSRANRLAVQLCYFDGLSCREVADFCGVSTSAIKSRLHEARQTMRREMTGMSTSARTPDPSSPVPGFVGGYSGDSYQSVLWQRAGVKELYLALYPEVRRDDRAFWDRFEHIRYLEGHLRLWEYAGVIRYEGDRVIGLVPVYTTDDYERLAGWHARVSRAMLDRVKSHDDDIEGLIREFRGVVDDHENLRHIALVGRLLATGVHAFLEDAFVGSAHDWGGLGPAYVWGGRGWNLPPTGGYSINSCGAGSAYLRAFQSDMRHAGTPAYNEHGSETAVRLIADLCGEPRSRAELLRDCPDPTRREHLFGQLLEAHWLQEQDGVLESGLPWLPWRSEAEADRLRPLAEQIAEPIAEAAHELRALAAQCSFAQCRFVDVAYVATSTAIGYVNRDLRRAGLVAEYPHTIPPGWGAWLYVPDPQSCHG